MGFYGNITYNTYGVQEKSIKPEHLDREYWSIKDKRKIKSEQEFRNFLGFEKVNEIRWNEIQELKNEIMSEEELNLLQKEETFIQQAWNTALTNSKKSLFKFHFHPDFSRAQDLYGSGMLIGFVRETETGHFLYFISLGGRAGQIFTYKLELGTTPIASIDDEILKHDALDVNKNDAINYMLSNIITTSQLKNKAITTNKIADEAVDTDQIAERAVKTDQIDEEAVTPSKLDRDYLEKTSLGTIKTYKDLCEKVDKFLTANSEETSDIGGTFYIINSLSLPLPTYYTTNSEDEKNNYIQSSSTPLNFGRCIVWEGDTTGQAHTIYIISSSLGQMWKVDWQESSPDGYDNGKTWIHDNGYYCKLVLKQTTSAMLTDGSVIESKIAKDAVTNDKILKGNIKPDRFDRNYLEKNMVWENEKDTIPDNWKEFFRKQKFIGTNYEKGNEPSGSLTFFLTFKAQMPSKFGGGYKTFDRVMSWCSSSYNENEGTGSAYFIAFGNHPIEIWAVTAIKKNKIESEKDKDDVVAVQEQGKETAYFRLWTTETADGTPSIPVYNSSSLRDFLVTVPATLSIGTQINFYYNDRYLEGIISKLPQELSAHRNPGIYYVDPLQKSSGWFYVGSSPTDIAESPNYDIVESSNRTFISDSNSIPSGNVAKIGDIVVYDSGSYSTSIVKICIGKSLNGTEKWCKLQIEGD